MHESNRTTTAHLETLLDRHSDAVERAVERFALPLHLYFLSEIEENASAFRGVADRLYPETVIAFASKSNPCRGAIRAAQRLGLGVDAASEYELRAALEEGVSPDRIICNGNAKSDAYIAAASFCGALIAVDNADELSALEALPAGRSPLRVLVRFRGMPLAGLTSEDQTTAADWTKFGFHVDEAPGIFDRIAAAPGLTLHGVSAHIGTQIANPVGYERLLPHMLALGELAQSKGHSIEAVNIGGGFPVRFLDQKTWARFSDRLFDRVSGRDPNAESVTWTDHPMGFAHVRSSEAEKRWIGKAYWTARPGADMLEHLLAEPLADGTMAVERLQALGSPTLILEPRRPPMAPSGVTLTKVMGTKEVLGHAVVALDMGINNHGTNLISPDIFPAVVMPRRDSDKVAEAFLAGRLCFSGDMISKAKIELNRHPVRGERLVLFHTGAYGADHFASNSCGFPLPGKVAVHRNGTLEVWRKPQRFEDVFAPIEAED